MFLNHLFLFLKGLLALQHRALKGFQLIQDIVLQIHSLADILFDRSLERTVLQREKALEEKDKALAEKDEALAEKDAALAKAVQALVDSGMTDAEAKKCLGLPH